MKPRLLLIFALIVLIPAGSITWLGWRVSRDEQHRVKREVMEVVGESLAGTRISIERVIEDVESEVFSVLDTAATVSEPQWREMGRSTPWIRQLFVLDGDGRLIYPDPSSTRDELSQREEDFLERTRAVWEAGGGFGLARGENDSPRSEGWHSWYWNNGLHLIIWQQDPKSGRVIGAEIERMRLLSEILADLPDTSPEAISGQARIELHDASDRSLYGWGAFEPEEGVEPLLEIKLSSPLSPWRLAYYSNLPSIQQNVSKSAVLNFIWLLAFSVLLIGALAYYFYREYCRDIREASQRVTFVNQVSHELKTPLTNIRMYAELLDSKLEDAGPEERRGIDVIVSESQRLSRLISNVLTFSRSQQDKLKLQYRPGVIDDSVRSALDHFRPTLEAAGFEIEFEGGAEKRSAFDADALEQILTNLISNVEKYAREGKWLRIESQMVEPDTCAIRVCDRGPGIPAGEEEWIFQPFERLSDKLSDAAGTGIGLNIARNLARLHGGDVVVEPGSSPEGGGSCFLVTLIVKPL